MATSAKVREQTSDDHAATICMELLTSLVRQGAASSIDQISNLCSSAKAVFGSRDAISDKHQQLATGICKYAIQKLVPNTDTSISAKIAELGLQVIGFTVPSAMLPSKDSLLLHYQCAKRMLLAGQLEPALTVSWKLHELCYPIGATQPLAAEYSDICTAAGLHVLVCTSELTVNSNYDAGSYSHWVTRLLDDSLPILLSNLRDAHSNESRKYLESVFKCIYKMVVNCAAMSDVVPTTLLPDIFAQFMAVSQDVNQHNKLPQYILRVMDDLNGKAHALAGLVVSLAEIAAISDTCGSGCDATGTHKEPMCTCSRVAACLDTALNATWETGAVLQVILASERWQQISGEAVLCSYQLAMAIQCLFLQPAATNAWLPTAAHSCQLAQQTAASTLHTFIQTMHGAAVDEPNSVDLQPIMSGLQRLVSTLQCILTDSSKAASLLQHPAALPMLSGLPSVLSLAAQLVIGLVSHHGSSTWHRQQKLEALQHVVTDHQLTLQWVMTSLALALKLHITVACHDKSSANEASAEQGLSDICVVVSAWCNAYDDHHQAEDLQDVNWFGSYASNIGKELSNAGQHAVAASVINIAWECCETSMKLCLKSDGNGVMVQEYATALEKRGRALVMSLMQANKHVAAAKAAVNCMAALSQVGSQGLCLATKVIHLHVTSRLSCLSAISPLHEPVGSQNATSSEVTQKPASRHGKGSSGTKSKTKPSVSNTCSSSEAAINIKSSLPPLLTESLASVLTKDKGLEECLLWIAYEEGREYARRLTEHQRQSKNGAAMNGDADMTAYMQAMNTIKGLIQDITPPATSLHARGVVLRHLLEASHTLSNPSVSLSTTDSDDAAVSNDNTVSLEEMQTAAEALAMAVGVDLETCVSMENVSHANHMDCDDGNEDVTLSVAACCAAAVCCTLVALQSFANAATTWPAIELSGKQQPFMVEDNALESETRAHTPRDAGLSTSESALILLVHAWCLQETRSRGNEDCMKWVSASLHCWAKLGSSLQASKPETGWMCCFPRPEVCLQMGLQLWQVCHITDHQLGLLALETVFKKLLTSSMLKPSSSLGNLAALLHSHTTCSTWAVQCCSVTPSPCIPCTLADTLCVSTACSSDFKACLNSLEAVRELCQGQTGGILSSTSAQAAVAACTQACNAAVSDTAGQVWLLLRVRLQQLKVGCQLQWGDLPGAWNSAHEGLKLSSVLYQSQCNTTQHTTSSATHNPIRGANTQPGSWSNPFAWSSVAAHLCSLLQTSRLDEQIGFVEDALCLAEECVRLALGFESISIAAIAMLHIAQMMLGQGRHFAGTQVMEACNQLLQECNPADPVHQLLVAEASLLTAQLKFDGRHDVKQKAALKESFLQQSNSLQQMATCDTNHGTPALALHSSLVACRVATGYSDLLCRAGLYDVAASALSHAEAAWQHCTTSIAPFKDHCSQSCFPNEHTGIVSGMTHPWPALCTQVLLQKHKLEAAQTAATAACNQVTNSQLKMLGMPQQTSLEALLADKLKISSGRGRKAKATKPDTANPNTVAYNKVSQIASILTALRHSWCCPSGLSAVCEMLLDWCVSADLPHAACMAQHLSMGYSACIQAQAASAGRGTAEPHSAAGERDGNDSIQDDVKVEMDQVRSCNSHLYSLGNNIAQQLQQVLLQCHKLLSCSHSTASRCQSRATAISQSDFDALTTELESVAESWFQQLLQAFPGSPAAVCISEADSSTKQQPCYIISRVTASSPAVVLIVPLSGTAGGANIQQDALTETGQDTGHTDQIKESKQQTATMTTTTQKPSRNGNRARRKDNVTSAETKPLAFVESKQITEPMTNTATACTTSNVPQGHSDFQHCNSYQQLLDQLSQLRKDSARSMASTVGLSTQEGKTAWWKARLQLDERMSQLLQNLQTYGLGPWGCLLLLQHSVTTRQQMEAPVAKLAAQYFNGGSGAKTDRQLLELLLLLVANGRHLPETEIRTAVKQLMVATKISEGALGEHTENMVNDVLNVIARHGQDGRVQLLTNSRCRNDAVPTSGEAGSTTSCIQGLDESDLQAESLRRLASDPVRLLPALQELAKASVPSKPKRTSKVNSKTAPKTTKSTRSTQTKSDMTKLQPAITKPRASSKRLASNGRVKATKSIPIAVATELTKDHQMSREIVDLFNDSASDQQCKQLQQQQFAEPTLQQDDTSQPVDACMGCLPELGSNMPPVLLVLSPALHPLPWESMPCMQASKTRVYRTPGLLFSAMMTAKWNSSCRSEQDSTDRAQNTQKPKKHLKCTSSSAGTCNSMPCRSTNAWIRNTHGHQVVNPADGYYLVNPSGDLTDTQANFESWFQQKLGWKGAAGYSPDPQHLLSALQSHALFVYMGHGSGEQYLSHAAARLSKRCAASLLMGCSSGRLRQHGIYPGTGAVITLLLAGSPVTVANLWDVTDKDIDRFCMAMLQRWHSSAESGGMPDRGAGIQQLESKADGQGHRNTSQTCCVERHEARQHNITLSSNDQSKYDCISSAVVTCRSACKLRYLIGAAPVVYGLPTHVIRGIANNVEM